MDGGCALSDAHEVRMEVEVMGEQEMLIVSSSKFLSTAFAFWIHFPFPRKDNLTFREVD